MKVLIVVMLMQTEFAGFYELIVHFIELLSLLVEIIRRAVWISILLFRNKHN